jgi:hypothetical protein
MEQSKTTETPLTLKDKFLVGQKMFRLAVGDVLSTCRDAFNPVGIEQDENLIPYLGRRAEERKDADEVNLKSYILNKRIGSVAARERLETGFTEDFFKTVSAEDAC